MIKLGTISVQAIIAVAMAIASIVTYVEVAKNNLQIQINAINNRISTDSLIRDTKLKFFQHYYGKDTLKLH